MLNRTIAASGEQLWDFMESLQNLVQHFEQLYSLNIDKYLPVKLYEKGKKSHKNITPNVSISLMILSILPFWWVICDVPKQRACSALGYFSISSGSSGHMPVVKLHELYSMSMEWPCLVFLLLRPCTYPLNFSTFCKTLLVFQIPIFQRSPHSSFVQSKEVTTSSSLTSISMSHHQIFQKYRYMN